MGHDDSSIDVELAVDVDGYLSQACPKCSGRFKIIPEEKQGRAVAYCPYCGHAGTRWFTSEQTNHIRAIAQGLAEKKRKRDSANEAGITEPKIGHRSAVPPIPPEPDEPSGKVRFPCCRQTIKSERVGELYCVACGERHVIV